MLEFSLWSVEKYSDVTFKENPSIGSRVVPCERKEGRIDGRTDMTKLIVAFRNSENAPKMHISVIRFIPWISLTHVVTLQYH